MSLPAAAQDPMQLGVFGRRTWAGPDSIGIAASQMDKVRAVARPMIEASRAEAGCAGYDYAVDMLEPDLMRVRELWRDEQALKDHFATPHMAAFLKGLRELRPV